MTSLSKKLTVTLLAVAAAVCIALGLLLAVPDAALAATAVDSTTVKLQEEDLTISNGVLSGVEDYETTVGTKSFILEIPASVTKIDDSAFSGRTALSGIDFSNATNLEEIGDRAFYGTTSSLFTELDLSGATKLTTIGDNAFNSGATGTAFCNGLSTITIPAGVTSIGKLAFANRTGLKTINYYATNCDDFTSTNGSENPFYKAGYALNLANASLTLNIGLAAQNGQDGITVEKIPAYMFQNDISASSPRKHKLTNINFINANITADNFGANAFAVSDSLKSVNFGSSTLASIGDYAFANCTALNNVSIPGGVQVIDASAFQGCTGLTTVTLNSELTEIRASAFQSCSSLDSVTIPGNVTFIGASAFQGCTSFTSITVPAGVEMIGANSFSGCTAVKEIHYNAIESTCPNIVSPFSNGGSGITVYIGTADGAAITRLPSGLFASTKIEKAYVYNFKPRSDSTYQQIFSNCADLSEVAFNSCDMSYISDGAFQGCTSLKNITLPDTVTAIGDSAFSGCSSLNHLTLPSSLTSIGKNAFLNCSSLYTVTIPDGVNTIGDNAFDGCLRLIEVCTKLSVAPGATDYGCVAKYAKNVYSSLSGSTKLNTSIEDFVFYLDDNSTYLITYTGSASDITLPANYDNNRYSVYYRAFMNNTKITSVKTAEGATLGSIGNQAFLGCTALKTVDLTGFVQIGEQSATEQTGYVFQNCTSLESAVIPEGVTDIKAYLFDGCVSLKEITIPASVTTIETNAFSGCTSLTKVKFAASDKLTAIGGSAFEKCSALTVIEIPSTVKTIQGSAFKSCTALKTVYLPKVLTTAGTGIFENSNLNNLILIAPDKTTYDSYSSLLSLYKSNLTYKVAVNLYYGEDKNELSDTEYRLYYRDYRIVEQEDKSWALTGGFPVQDGYLSSVWYEDDACSGESITGTRFNALLALGDAINLYAITKSTPDIKPVTNLSYDGNSFSINRLYDGEFDANVYDINITGYSLYYSREQAVTPEKCSDAGYYTLSVTLKEEYGVWAQPFEITVTVTPKTIYADALNWTLSNGNPLTGGTLYLYDDNNDENNLIPYTQKKDGEEPYDTIEVSASYVSLTNSEVTIVLANSEYYTINTADYTENSKKDSGIWTAGVRIQAANNYQFMQSTAAAEYGITVVQVPNTNIWNVSKIWYIAATEGNKLIFSGGSDYEIEGWAYNQATDNPEAPWLIQGNPASLITFDLYSYTNALWATGGDTDGLIVGGASYDKFHYYINKSMPAGDYTIIIHVSAFGTDTIVNGLDSRYEFTVREASYSGSLTGTLNNGAAKEFSYKYDGKLHLGDTSSVTVTNLSPSVLHPVREGYWLDDPDKLNFSDELYSQFKITYNIYVKGGYTGTTGNNYYSEEDFIAGIPEVLPISVGQYRICYYVSAPSYKASTDINNPTERERYYYEVKIYDVLSVPEINEVTYTGEHIAPVVSNPYNYFDVLLLDPQIKDYSVTAAEYIGKDDYSVAGTHRIALKVRGDFAIYNLIRWESPQTFNGVTYAIATFKVNPAVNTAGTLSVIYWDYGEFNPDLNTPIWSTKFVGYEGFTFTLTLDDDSDVYYVYGSEENGFEQAGAGRYTLTAYAVGATSVTETNGYNWLEVTAEFPVVIGQVQITWKTTPYIAGWRYGDDEMFAMPVAEVNTTLDDLQDAVLGSAYFCVASEVGSASVQKYASLDELKVEGRLPAGEYALVYELTGDANIEEFLYAVRFTVFQAENYWEKASVNDWTYGEYSSHNISLVPHFGSISDVEYEIYVLDKNGLPSGSPYTSLDSLVDKNSGEIDCGKYMLIARLKGGENYAAMRETELTFQVMQAENVWVTLPGIVGWNEGRWNAETNSLMGEAKFGTVQFAIFDENGKEYNINNLNSLGVGRYELRVTVVANDNYKGFNETVSFSVLEDSVGMTGLIAATMVFAALAVGLAVGAVVLLFIRSKKIDQEFRKMVKSELHRR